MALEVEVSNATNLPNLEKIGTSDPYVILEFQGVKKKTQVISGNLNPEWNEKFTWEVGKQQPGPSDCLSIWVKDYERVGRNRLMGQTTLLLRNALESTQPLEYELNLSDHNQRSTSSTLFLTVTYQKPQTAPAGVVAGQIPQGNVDSVDGTAHPEVPGFSAQTTDVLRRDAFTGAVSNTKKKYQIRVRVIEARNLIGSNISPICQVTFSHLSKQTQVAKSTCSPWWNEVFFFTIECTLLELYTEILEFSVRNARAFRSDMTIGFFKLDVGQIYSQTKHSYLNKWLLLSTDDEEAVAEVMGYLKVSVVVLGPGDECPDLDSQEDNEKDDIESNLLLPSGTQLKPATFIVDLYQATDLPRMDSGVMEGVKRILNIENKKELIDPYLEVSFAGNQVVSKIVYGDDNPRWNEKLLIGFQFPSVCESIKLTLKDWDRVSDDDTIATAHIPLPLISAPGHSGFLPCFGPAWVNLYGAPREFKLLGSDYDKLNEGTAEGCSFRGRALLSIKTDLGTYPNRNSIALPSDDTIRVQFFCRRRRFRLHATFLDATMVNVTDTPVEFEISIGNYGNKFEDTFVPSSSSTQPTNAVFDGCQYYYLPWKGVKPCVVVTSQWEDVTFRLETLNVLNRIIERMEAEIHSVSHSFSDIQELYYQELVMSLVDRFLVETDIALPEPIPGQQRENELDRLLRKRRTDEINNLRDEARVLRESGLELTDILQELETLVGELRKLAVEPQNSIPDIIIWMLSGKKRIAYQRIPAHLVLFSDSEERCGKYCGKLQTMILKKPEGNFSDDFNVPAMLRIKLWFGLQCQERHWRDSQTDADLTVFAETYENQINVLGKWTNNGLAMTRPSWSDASGTVKLHREKFVAPVAWRFEGDWFIDPEPSLKYEDDAGRQKYIEDVFENQTRIPGEQWMSSLTAWSDIRGDPATPRDEIKTPPGWEWDDVWQTDLHRAVDEEGWEYTVEATLGGYHPVEKTYHLCRRRRWVRQRNFVALPETLDSEDVEKGPEDEGWEYSTLFNLRFHARERRMDLVRRRRWHRKLVADDPSAPLVFEVSSDSRRSSAEDTKISLLSCPRLCLTYKESHQVELRAYIYQARDLVAGDKTGFSDPYACISFLNQSQKTEVMFKTLCPTWDQTLIFDGITIFGNSDELHQQPPSTVIEIYDRDTHGADEFLGRVSVVPVVQLDPNSIRSPPLMWHSLVRGTEKVGDILASFELFMIDDENPPPCIPPKRGNVYIVPAGIRPVLQLTAIEILCWGVRNMKTFELSPISSPSVEFECGGKIVQSKIIKDVKQNPNFDDPVLYLEMMLPQESNFMPPMNIKVKDHRAFGRKPIIGTRVITNLHNYYCQPVHFEENAELNLQQDIVDTVIDIPNESGKDLKEFSDSAVDWWAKYYASTGEHSKAGKYLQQEYDTLKIFSSELEKVEPFRNFSDFLNTFPLTRGKTKVLEESLTVGEFKGTLRVYPLPPDPNEPRPQRMLKTLPQTTKEEITVRVYIIRALDLAPKDRNGKADPYVIVKLGKKKIDNRKKYKPNTLNPAFGEVFELSGTLPVDKDLTVSIWDYDLLSSDDKIGETVIDLENRYLTKYRATCGLPQTFQVSGVNKWRDSKNPTEILEDVCILHNVPKPRYLDQTTAIIGNTTYMLTDFEKHPLTNPHLGSAKQRLALHILNTMNLVPEHVETRALYNPLSPGLQQGKLQMWVDIFPKSFGPPGPVVDITPRIPMKYQLRVVIWNTHEVPLNETSIVAGDTMSDIYVKGWLHGQDQPQKTDVHYRSMDGEGNFNWRMIFPFEYLPAENNMVVTKKKHFWSLDATEHYLPPRFTFQVWDNDMFSADDFLGTLEFNLSAMPLPTKSADKCDLHQLGIEEDPESLMKFNPENQNGKFFNLFEKKRIHGFWPCYTTDGEKRYSTAGKLEMEIELLTEEEALNKPAGRGRDEPNMNPKLEPPNRPATSFLWLTSPWKSFKFILWGKYKWYCITILIIFLALLLIILFIYSFPEAIANSLVN